VYLSYTEAAAQQPGDLGETGDARFGDFIDFTDNVLRGGAVARGRLVGSQLQGVQVIWRQVPKTVGRGHFGHRLLFGPDGKLYITSGDRMRFDPAQRLASNLGKVVRINPDGSIPVDNPFNGRENARGDVYSLGHRNILAATFDQGGRLWVFEMGPQGGDEINLVQPGRNYGWPLVSNGDNYAGASIPRATSSRRPCGAGRRSCLLQARCNTAATCSRGGAGASCWADCRRGRWCGWYWMAIALPWRNVWRWDGACATCCSCRTARSWPSWMIAGAIYCAWLRRVDRRSGTWPTPGHRGSAPNGS
jgi:hypothetical protein